MHFSKQKVLLIATNCERKSNNRNNLFSIGLLYLKNVAEAEGYSCQIIDAYCANISNERVSQILTEYDPAVVGFLLNNEEMYKSMVEILAFQGKSPIIFVGGYYATSQAEKILLMTPQVSYVIRGEGEVAFANALKAISNNQIDLIPSMKGISVLISEGLVHENPKETAIQDLDSLGKLDLKTMSNFLEKHEWSIVTSRGCTAACSFCMIGAHWGKYRSWRGHSASYLVNHIEEIVNVYGATFLQIVDDQFLGSLESIYRAHEFVHLMQFKEIFIPFYFMARADTISEQRDLLRGLRSIGLETVFLGIETSSEFSRRRLNKELNQEDIKKAFEVLDELGIEIAIGTIIFTPWTKVSDLIEDLEFIENAMNQFPTLHFYGLNDLEILETTPLGAKHGNGQSWRYDWAFEELAVQHVFDCWQILESSFFLPAMEMLSPLRNLTLRRKFCQLQVETLKDIIYSNSNNPEKLAFKTHLRIFGLFSEYKELDKFEKIMNKTAYKDLDVERCFK